MSIVRSIVFVCCAAFILLAPAHRQLFDGTLKLPRWEMFSGIAVDIYKVKFETEEGGKRREIDRFAALGYDEPVKAPRAVRLIMRENEAFALARRLCGKLEGAPVYMRLEDAKRSGWERITDGQTDLCKAGLFEGGR